MLHFLLKETVSFLCQRQLSLTFWCLASVILDPAENQKGMSLQTHKLGPFYEVSPLHVESPELFSQRMAGGGVTHLNEKVSRLVQLGLTWTPLIQFGRKTLLLHYERDHKMNDKWTSGKSNHIQKSSPNLSYHSHNWNLTNVPTRINAIWLLILYFGV